MNPPSDFQSLLIQLFDFQKFDPAPSLSAVCKEAEQFYDEELSDDALSMIYAAGDIKQTAATVWQDHSTDSEKSL